MTNGREFILSGIVEGASGVFHAIGRCGDVTIRRGDSFDAVENRGQVEKVDLQVMRIEAYDQEWDELGPGMTARLDMKGQGLDLLRPRSILLVSEAALATRES